MKKSLYFLFVYSTPSSCGHSSYIPLRQHPAMLRDRAGGEGNALIRFLYCGYFLTPPSLADTSPIFCYAKHPVDSRRRPAALRRADHKDGGGFRRGSASRRTAQENPASRFRAEVHGPHGDPLPRGDLCRCRNQAQDTGRRAKDRARPYDRNRLCGQHSAVAPRNLPRGDQPSAQRPELPRTALTPPRSSGRPERTSSKMSVRGGRKRTEPKRT